MISLEEMKKEKLYLVETLELLNKVINQKDESVLNADNKILELKKYIWQNITEIDTAEANFYSNSAMDYRSVGKQELVKSLVLKKMLLKPYFGRIDFLEAEEINPEKIYIGLSSLSDNEFNQYIYDWRSPIASVFYDNEMVGKCSYNAPNGEIKGKMLLKRQYKIEDGILLAAFDNSMAIDDSILRDVLSDDSSEKMKSIVNSLQKEQNQAIRDISSSVLIIEGPAGSGKTSIALSRIGFLLYRFKDSLKSEDIIIFSPSDVFSNYISDVLPELGENNVLQTGFSDYMNKFIIEFKKVETYIKFIERIYNNKNSISNEFIKIKMDASFVKVINKYIEMYTNSFKLNNVSLDKKFGFNSEQLDNLYHKEFSIYFPVFRLRKISNYIQMKYTHQSTEKYKKKELESFVDSKLKLPFDFVEFIVQMYDNKDFKLLLKKEYPKLNIEEFVKKNQDNFKNDTLLYEDAIILSYIKGKLEGFAIDKRIKQVVIDEAQDYTEMQYIILKQVFANAKFTILGDANQSINPLLQYDSLDQIQKVYNNDNSTTIKINKVYRNTKEINTYCNEILGLNNENAINRTGEDVISELFENVKDSYINILKFIKDNQQYKNIAIITENDKINSDICKFLVKNEINHKTYNKFEENTNLHVLPVYYAKGIEFDSVLAYTKKDPYENNGDKKMFYVACSRALHKLHTMCKNKK